MRTVHLLAILWGGCATESLDPTGTWSVDVLPAPLTAGACEVPPFTETWNVTADGDAWALAADGTVRALTPPIACDAATCVLDAVEDQHLGEYHQAIARRYQLDAAGVITGTGAVQVFDLAGNVTCRRAFSASGRRD